MRRRHAHRRRALGDEGVDRLVDAQCEEPDAFFAAVLARLMVRERLDVDVAFVAPGIHPRDVIHRLPSARPRDASPRPVAPGKAPADSRRRRVRPRRASARTSAPTADRCRGESYLDDTRLFDGTVAAVEIEPLGTIPVAWARGATRAVEALDQRPRRADRGPAVFVEREGILTPVLCSALDVSTPTTFRWRLVMDQLRQTRSIFTSSR